MHKAKGKAKEAYGALVGDEALKTEGRAEQRKAEAEAEARQREKTRAGRGRGQAGGEGARPAKAPSVGRALATNGKRAERSKHMGLLGGRSGKDDKDEGAMDRAKGRLMEAGGALTGDKKLKREGRSDQRKGRAKQKKGDLKDLLS